jgi:molecular chaperone DnaK (HSP70)
MILGKLKADAETRLGEKITQAVISIWPETPDFGSGTRR